MIFLRPARAGDLPTLSALALRPDELAASAVRIGRVSSDAVADRRSPLLRLDLSDPEIGAGIDTRASA